MTQTRITLAGGTAIPQVGLGTWPMTDDECRRVVADAIGLGYRLIDTAENYRNEVGVGAGVRESGVPREDLFITSKFNKQWHGRDLVRQACEASLERLGLDYLDLFLIHWPNPDQDRYVEAWEGLIALRETGLVRAIGTSNFLPEHLERLQRETGVMPEVNQIELYPYLDRAEERAFHAEHGIVTEAWSPLARGGAGLLEEPLLVELAQQHGVTPAQIVLAWDLALGVIPIPKSANTQRLRANLDIVEIALSDDEVARICALDSDQITPENPLTFGH